jgi:hypothetical protein
MNQFLEDLLCVALGCLMTVFVGTIGRKLPSPKALVARQAEVELVQAKGRLADARVKQLGLFERWKAEIDQEYERQLSALKAILHAEMAYGYQLEQIAIGCLTCGNPDDTLTVRQLLAVLDCDPKALLDSRPPVAALLECIGRHDWEGFERLQQGLVTPQKDEVH